MKFWELPNTFWGTILGVWVSLILFESIPSPPTYYILFSLLFLSLLFMVLVFLNRCIETGKLVYIIITIIFGIALAIATWLFFELLKYIGIDIKISLAHIAFITILLIFWVVSVEYKRYESKIGFRNEGWYE